MAEAAAGRVPSTTRSTGTSPSGSPAAFSGREPLAAVLPRRVAARRLRRGHRRGRGAGRRRTPGCARRARRGPRWSTAPAWVVGQRVVDATPARAAHRAGRRTHGRRAGSRRSAAGSRAPRPGCCSGTSPQRVLGQYDLLVLDDDAARRRRLLRGRQHPRVGEALRVPAPRLPAVDRDPRGHPPGAVHRGAVDEALLPLAGRERAVVDRSRSDAGSCRRWPAPPTSSAAAATRSTTAASSALLASDEQRGALAQRAGAHVVARGSRQQRDEPARARARRRAGAHGPRPPGPPAEHGHGRVPAEAGRARVEDAPVRGGGGVRRRGRARGGPAGDRRRVAGPGVPAHASTSSARPLDWLARVDGAIS